MALPTIPTSFVPYSASSAARRFSTDFTGIFGFFSYGVLAIMFVLSIGVFVYGRILTNVQSSKDAQLQTEIAKIDQKTVASFVRLHDRLLSGKTLLQGHVAFSNFLASVGTLLPTTVRFSSLNLSFNTAGLPKLDGTGVSKSFNALAVVSTTFATDGHIKDAIFSNIGINKDNSVSFTLSATLDPKSVAFSPSLTSSSGDSGLPQEDSATTPSP
ncbi:hypothetical protein A3A36_00480 [Candidatus Kaiserbacteria bacterium RIFCSPLOWO2_01_FULL_52_12b]|uniref:PilN domain-containing protein n=1 Tax=Candidatus Kaiserbacteria bacterium RIFCSPLOWO2_01_FULL_52_12b TaxID=1798509 RepID=A0A1F6EY25_9BACT|nr:MAG: hypothetical protein A3A36_00480 [Candidatus Kaiserbacteria bacterium RIFCSPLOWO2_01_FULL_52_12b]